MHSPNARSGAAAPETPADTRARVRAVGRAASDLRRGVPVAIREEQGGAVVAAAETLEGAGLAELRAAGEISLVLTARRAAALGLAEGGGAPVRLALGATVTLDQIRALADPTLAPGAPAPAPAAACRDEGLGAAAALALTRRGGLLPAVVVAPVSDAEAAARISGLVCVPGGDILAHAPAAGRALRAVTEARVPLAGAESVRMIAFRPGDGGPEHLAIVVGEGKPPAPALVRVHSACFTGDLLASLRCDCGDQLRGAVAAMAEAGGGVLVYLSQEGRGIGLTSKLRSYRLQDQGLDTVEANECLGFEADERVFQPAAEILRALGISQVRLMTNNPDKLAALAAQGIDIAARVPHAFPANGHNETYLRTKAGRRGHLL